MALDIFFAEDIRNALVAANEASVATAAAMALTDTDDFAHLRAFREGYRAALVVMALAFGISPQMVMPSDERGALEARLGLEREDVEIEA